MAPEKTVVSGRTVYRVKQLLSPTEEKSACTGCCFYSTHLNAYPGPDDCYQSKRAEACASSFYADSIRRIYINPQKLRHYMCELITRKLIGE